MDESVLVIPEARLLADPFDGFRPADAANAALLDPAHFTFRPRREVETDPSFKQLIPYCVLMCRGRVFHYTRGSGGGEKRLTAKRSVGIGGHISEADAAGGSDPYRTGMLRELTEEVGVPDGWTQALVGFLFDPTTPVGRVHLGVVHVFELPNESVTPREDGIVAGGFATPEELLADPARFEEWSLHVLNWLTTKR